MKFEALLEKIPATFENLEAARREYLLFEKVFLILCVLLPCIVLLITYAVSSETSAFWAFLLTVAAEVCVYEFLIRRKRSNYIQRFRDDVFPHLIRLIDEDLEYRFELTKETFDWNAGGLFTPASDFLQKIEMKPAVLMSGKGGQFLEGDIILRTGRQSETQRFLFLSVDCDCGLESRTYLLPKKIERSLGRFSQFFHTWGKPPKTELISLGDTDFDKQFSVFSFSEEETKVLLRKEMQEFMVALQSEFGDTVRAQFFNRRILLALPLTNQSLEPSLNCPADDLKQLTRFGDIISRRLEILQEFDGLMRDRCAPETV
ncbi:MAG: hypothetical protein CMO55_03910 [Verrucomicrobiales bacterium]|nr:hypothetical protein [Verrucomicrobiales bacterium]